MLQLIAFLSAALACARALESSATDPATPFEPGVEAGESDLSPDWTDVPASYQSDSSDSSDHPDRGGLYLQLSGGLTTTQSSNGPGEEIDFDEGFAIPLAIGYRFGADDSNAFSFDLELEGIYTDQDVDRTGVIHAVTDVTALGGLVNGVAELAISDNFAFYGGAGVGVAGLDVGTQSDELSDFNEEDGPFLAWEAKAGLRFWTGEHVALNLGYRFLNIDNAEIDDDINNVSFDLETQQHVLELGLRFVL